MEEDEEYENRKWYRDIALAAIVGILYFVGGARDEIEAFMDERITFWTLPIYVLIAGLALFIMTFFSEAKLSIGERIEIALQNSFRVFAYCALIFIGFYSLISIF